MILPSLKYESELWGQGFTQIVGVDEVGRGAWAGPVVAAAVIISPSIQPIDSVPQLRLIRDSKTLSPAQRQSALQAISENQWISSAIGQASVAEIAESGISAATFMAMSRAINALPAAADYLLIDGFAHPSQSIPQKAVIKGDAHCLSIAAASIVAKQYRDTLMRQLGQHYPQYGFNRHVGYGTALHRQAIADHGLSPVHRHNFHLKFLD